MADGRRALMAERASAEATRPQRHVTTARKAHESSRTARGPLARLEDDIHGLLNRPARSKALPRQTELWRLRAFGRSALPRCLNQLGTFLSILL
jgi:hypothetical protein